jgi:N-acetylglucosamine-6-phosphate deacetylase
VADAVPYVHVEGPSISPTEGFRGAHPADQVRPPSLAEFDRWQNASGGLVGMVILSPLFKAPKSMYRYWQRGVGMSRWDIRTPPQKRYVGQ